MSTKSEIQNLIDTNLASASNITATEHREVEESFVSELYATEVRELHEQVLADILSITTPETANFFYDIYFTKKGNTVLLNGHIRNKTGSIFSGKFLNIDSSVYLGKTNIPYYGVTSNGSYINIVNGIVTVESIGNNIQSFFNLTYQTND